MVTGEDYNILSYTKFSNIVKAKAVNPTASGINVTWMCVTQLKVSQAQTLLQRMVYCILQKIRSSSSLFL